MEKNIQVLESQEVVMTFTYSAEEWQKAQDKEYRKLSANLNVKGFRKGHVPADIARRHINPNEVVNEAINSLVNASYRQAMDEGKYMIVTQPTLSVTKLDKDGMTAEVKFALPPVVTLGDYKGLDVKEKAVRVTKEDVAAFIEKLRTDHATMNVKDGEAVLGDTVIIDFKGFINDSPFDGGEAKAYELKLGSNSFVPGFEDQLVGIKAGEDRSINVVFPTNYVENLAGKEARFEIHCSDVKETVLPEINDEFIADINIADVKEVKDLEAHAKKTIKERKTTEVKNARINEIVTKVIDSSEVKVGSAIIEDEAKAAIERIKKQVESNGLTFKDYLSINNITEEKLLENQRKESLTNLKAYLVIEEICHKEHIVADEKALDEYYESLSKQYNIPLETVKEQLQTNIEAVKRNLRATLFNKFIEEANPIVKKAEEVK